MVVSPRLAWWYAARFGMIIHLGSYSYLGRGEWAFSIENWAKAAYQTQCSAKFDPVKFDAATIVSYAKMAGMKYLVITAKHHEGFAMWHSHVRGFVDFTGKKLYNLYDYTAYKADPLAALKAECDWQGIKFGLYYSILDWNHPSQTIYKNGDFFYSQMASMEARAYYISDMKAHLRELITRYDPAILWFDGDWCGNPPTPKPTDWWIESDGIDLYNYVRSLKSDIIVNERVKRDLGLGDFANPEQIVPSAPLSRLWETVETMNGAWGYDASKENQYKTSTSLIQELVTVVSRDGNFLLNIGPMGDGVVTNRSVAALKDFSSWMHIYSDSIYGATASPYSTEPSWGLYTKKAGKLFAHVLHWPITGTIRVPALQNLIHRVYLMNDASSPLDYTISAGNINISLPSNAPNPTDSVIVIEVAGVLTE
jgi:alpha-L-fucosidase